MIFIRLQGKELNFNRESYLIKIGESECTVQISNENYISLVLPKDEPVGGNDNRYKVNVSNVIFKSE